MQSVASSGVQIRQTLTDHCRVHTSSELSPRPRFLHSPLAAVARLPHEISPSIWKSPSPTTASDASSSRPGHVQTDSERGVEVACQLVDKIHAGFIALDKAWRVDIFKCRLKKNLLFSLFEGKRKKIIQYS